MSAARTNRILIGAVALVAVAAASAGITAAVMDDDDDRPSAQVSTVTPRAENRGESRPSDNGESTDGESSTGPSAGAPGSAGSPGSPGPAASATVPAGWDDDGLTDAEEDAQLLSWATIGAAEAERIALELVPDSRVEGTIEIDEDRGRVVWDVDLRDADGREHDVQIDAGNGEVVDHDIDD